MEWHDLENMTVVKLREEAHEKGLLGVHGMNKPTLIEELAKILEIEKPHEEMGDEAVHSKSDLKHQIHELKAERNKLIESQDHKGLKVMRRKIHGLKRQIKKMHLAAQKAS